MDDRLPVSYVQKSRLDLVSDIALQQGELLIDWLLKYSYVSPKRIFVATNTPERFSIYLYTDTHVYHITTTSSGYLGCTASTRKARPGEEWTRGNDLPNGRFSEYTLQSILGAIVGYELKEVINVVTRMAATPKVQV